MAEAAGAFYAVETLVEATVAAAKAVYDPTLPLKATLTPVDGIPGLARYGHSVNVVKGRAYIYGGVTVDEGGSETLADAATHVLILPVSGTDSVDYTILATPAGDSSPSHPPPARQGHASATIDGTVFVTGGTGLAGSPVDGNEDGTVWALNTRTGAWSELKPDLGDSGGGAAAVKSSGPGTRIGARLVGLSRPRGARETEREDSSISQPASPQLDVDPAAEGVLPELDAEGTYGTLILAGGRRGHEEESGDLQDAWAFDIASRTWAELPSLPSGTTFSGATALDGRLYAYTGNGRGFILNLVEAKFNDKGGSGSLGLISDGHGWQEIDTVDENRPHGIGRGAALHVVTTGQGRRYLVLLGGQGSSGNIHVLQIRPEGMTAASLKDAARMAIKKGTGENRWSEVKYYDSNEVLIQESQSGRGLRDLLDFGASKVEDEDGSTILVHGGRQNGKIQDGGLLVTLSI